MKEKNRNQQPSTREHDFARNEDQQHDARFHHTINKTWKQLRFVAIEKWNHK